MDTVRVVLTTPISYTANGGVREGKFIELRAPSSRAYRVALRIKQQLMRAIMEQRAQVETITGTYAAPPEPTPAPAPDADPAGPRGPAFLQMLAASTADLAAIAADVRELLVEHEAGRVDGETPLTALLVDRLSMPDFEAVLGEYLATFPLA